MTEPLWRVELFGGLRVTAAWPGSARAESGPLRFRTQKTGALLAYLAYHSRRSHSREELVELFWPEDEPEAARHKLRVALSSLRQLLNRPDTPAGPETPAALWADRFTAAVDPAAVRTDVAEFEAALDAAAAAPTPGEGRQRLAAAVELYRGPLLAGYYEEWVLPEQERLADRCFQALRRLSAAFEQAGDLERALDCARRAVNVDPLREEAHQVLMRLYAAAGQPCAALRQYHALERLLRSELESTPSPATQRLANEIERLAGTGREEGPPPGPKTAGQANGARPPEGGSFAPSAAPGAAETSAAGAPAPELEFPGGAVPLDSPFYVVRPTDADFSAAILRRDSIVLVKGASQTGKTSLLARGLQQARERGARIVLADLGLLNAAQLESAERLLRALAESFVEQLGLEADLDAAWGSAGGANLAFRRFVQREVLEKVPDPVVWALDGVDRLFGCAFGGEIFSLLRSWHNQRALDPGGPWSRFTLAIAYATEAHLFITDLNRSPFNVGTRLFLGDFSPEQVAELNARHGGPLRDPAAVACFHALLGGHPYLVRRGLHAMATEGLTLPEFEARAGQEEWLFGEHLRRLLGRLQQEAELRDAVREVLAGRPCPSAASFYRLRAAGVLAGDTAAAARPRCLLYARYLHDRLA